MRNRIITRAFEAFNFCGVKFTMADLARDLAVSKATIYQYFESKEELIGTIISILINDMCRQDDEIIKDTTLDFFAKMKRLMTVTPTILGPFTNRMIGDIQKHLPEESLKVEAYQKEKWNKIEKLIIQQTNKGVLQPINLAIVHKMYTLSVGLIDYQFLSQNNLTVYDVLSTFAQIFTFGLVGQNNFPKKE